MSATHKAACMASVVHTFFAEQVYWWRYDICRDKILMIVYKKISCGSTVCAFYVAQFKCLHCTLAADIKYYVGAGVANW
jgi:hypothetical protein